MTIVNVLRRIARHPGPWWVDEYGRLCSARWGTADGRTPLQTVDAPIGVRGGLALDDADAIELAADFRAGTFGPVHARLRRRLLAACRQPEVSSVRRLALGVLCVLLLAGCALCGHGPVLSTFCSADDLGLYGYRSDRYAAFAGGCTRRGGEPSVVWRNVSGNRRLGHQCDYSGISVWETP